MIIAMANEKGGSGKTTTTAAIVSGATFRGKRALAIDLDPQCNLSFIMGADAGKPGAFELLTGTGEAVVQHTEQGDIITGSQRLAAADTTLTGSARVYALQDALKLIEGAYDYIVIDCPPSLGTLLINALTAADGVIIPLRAKIIHLQGLYLLADTIRETRESCNPDLTPLGVLFTEYNGRTNSTKEMADAITDRAAELGIPVFQTRIRTGVAVDEAQIFRKSLFEYAPNSNPARDYGAFLDELEI